MKPLKERFEAKFEKSEGCWEWMATKNRDGYGQFKLAGGMQKAHRVAYQLYVGEILTGLCVCHVCDNPGCVRPDHLFLGTQTDNMRDCANKGRCVRPDMSGEKHWGAKLTEEQAKVIKAKRSEGARNVDLAREFRISQQTICNIAHGRRWIKA